MPLCAQEILSNLNTSWTQVLPGSVICEPVSTSYGFCLATDARNIMGFSSNGKLLWEKNIGRSRNINLTVLPGDFILFHDSDSNNLRLFNPSGSEVWQKQLDFTPLSKAFAGRDGRFFLHGENKIICLGINGNVRWQLETSPQKNLPLQELSDGSIIIFLCDEEGKTKGLRISPFGEELENITFSGSVKNCCTCSEGVLLVFTDGSAGLFSVKNGLSVNRWVTSVKAGNLIFLVSPDKSDFRLLSLSSSEIKIYKIDLETGYELASWKLSGINGDALLLSVYSDSGIFLCDSNSAILFDEDFHELWTGRLPSEVKTKSINQLFYLQQDYLVFCNKNWSMNAYHTCQTTSKSSSQNKNKNLYYSDFISVDLNDFNFYIQDSFFDALKNPERVQKIKEGNFGTSEAEWLSQTLSIARLVEINSTSQTFGTHREASVFETDSKGLESILTQLTLLCTNQTQNAAAAIISKSNNKSVCRMLMVNLTGYDPDGKLLQAIEKNALQAGNRDTHYLTTICDTVYSICYFMGRPAYNKQGKDILKNFLGPAYNSDVRLYARDTLKKIIALEL